FNDVKASACWVWMPKNRVVDHVSKNINASVTLKRLDYINAQGRFKSVMAWDLDGCLKNSGEARVQQRSKKKNPDESASKAQERERKLDVFRRKNSCLCKENEGLFNENLDDYRVQNRRREVNDDEEINVE
ncbi:hypothetical protein Tco_1470024, partial [Tanacetum coccineum]